MPRPERRELRLRMRAAGVNPMDWRVRDGAPNQFDQQTRFPLILGLEGAGAVDELGAGVTAYVRGDEVFGLFWPEIFEFGTFAEYLVVSEDARMACKPNALSFEQAAALPLAGGAAMAALNWLEIGQGQQILIVGATGGVGSYACQLAKLRGARVIATARASEVTYIRGLGADAVIDFEREDVPSRAGDLADGCVDAMLDLVNTGDRFSQNTTAVREGGRVVSLTFGADVDELAKRNIRAHNLLSHPVKQDFDELARLASRAELQIPIELTLPLAEANDALELSQSGMARGKIVLTIT